LAALARTLAFVGFMGAGKTRAAQAVAAALGSEAADTDELLEADLGEPIASFFEREGEVAFREREERLVLELLRRGGVVALGGGAIESERVRAALADAFPVWCRVSEEAAWERASRNEDRPLARKREEFSRRYHQRLPLYEQIARGVLPEDGAKDSAPAAAPSLRVAAGLESARMIWATSESGSYPVHLGRGLLGADFWSTGQRAFCVTDTNVGPFYADRLNPLVGRVEIEPGEMNKTLEGAAEVWRGMVDARLTRHDRLLALGGGVVGDLAGFCAATYQRGMPLVQLPTTLVAQVDSAYGGKTGVDLPEAKNYIGVYHLPEAVVADADTLATLPREELAAGFAEVIKTALLAGGRLWDRVRSIGELDHAHLDDVIFACALYKLDVVAADERDAGRRAVLNLGHTVGHAIEAASGYRLYRHGEAIGLGLLAALSLSTAVELRDEVRDLLARHGLPIELDPAVETEQVLAAVERDKKRTAEGVGFVLLERPGEPLTGRRIDADRVRAAVEELVPA
jgi:shikimate kinase/3-dehydroquinate synthase